MCTSVRAVFLGIVIWLLGLYGSLETPPFARGRLTNESKCIPTPGATESTAPHAHRIEQTASGCIQQWRAHVYFSGHSTVMAQSDVFGIDVYDKDEVGDRKCRATPRI